MSERNNEQRIKNKDWVPKEMRFEKSAISSQHSDIDGEALSSVVNHQLKEEVRSRTFTKNN